MIDREAVRENAKYLRNVRPIDPEEISEYVTDQPHPAVVRRVLREEAYDLGLRERDDGTFVPVEDDPVRPPFHGVEELPERYVRRVENVLVDRYGPDWHRGESGDRLRETIRRLKDDYYRNRSVEYDADVAAGYACYHLADFYAAVQYVLDDLARDGLLSKRLRVLDVGAGVGGPALGLFDYLPDDAVVDYHAVEPSAAADVLEELLEAAPGNVRTTIHRTTAEAFDPASVATGEGAATVDLLLFANVLSELDAPAETLRRYLGYLDPAGTCVALAPADRETSINLRSVEREVEDDAVSSPGDGGRTTDGGDGTEGDGDTGGSDERIVTVYAPGVRLWPGERPSDQGWSFDTAPDLEVPAVQERLDDPADGDGEFVNTSVRYAYSLMRIDGRRRYEVEASTDAVAKFAESDDHVTSRVDCLAIKLSHDLAEDGNSLFRIGDGSQSVDHYAVLTRETGLNSDLREAEYGELLSVEGALVLWNDDEGAYNLVIDEDSVVDRIPL